MSYSLLRLRRIRARRAHSCIWCGRPIGCQSIYWREKSVYDGYFQNFAWHEACRKDSQDNHFSSYVEEFTPGENEQPFRNLAMVDAVLNALEPADLFRGEM